MKVMKEEKSKCKKRGDLRMDEEMKSRNVSSNVS